MCFKSNMVSEFHTYGFCDLSECGHGWPWPKLSICTYIGKGNCSYRVVCQTIRFLRLFADIATIDIFKKDINYDHSDIMNVFSVGDYGA